MQDNKYTTNQLNSMTVHDLRIALSKLGGAPGQSKRSELISQIKAIQSGKVKPTRSNRGRKPKFKETEKLLNEANDLDVQAINVDQPFGYVDPMDENDVVDKDSFNTPNPNVGKGYDDLPENFISDLLGFTRQNGFLLQTSYDGVSVPNKVYFHDSGVEDVRVVIAHGVLEVMPDGYGFLRNYDRHEKYPDFYVDRQQIRNFKLQTGDFVIGYATNKFDKNSLNVHQIVKVNGINVNASYMLRGESFEGKTAVFPNKRIVLEQNNDITLRFLDLTCPIGFGQRALIVAPPKTGKTTMLKKIATSIQANHPNVHLIVMLIDERPEEVTDFLSCIDTGEVVASTFDESPEKHTRLAEVMLERSKRLVEMGKDVVILVDSITKLTRAYNNALPSSGKLLSGGIDPKALVLPKKFFGSARNFSGEGSLTIIATALVETGSKLDDVIFEEFKGTGNMEIVLSRVLSDRRLFPAIDLIKSGTRNEELLLTEEQLQTAYKIRDMFSLKQNAHEILLEMIKKTNSNSELINRIGEWFKALEI